ncbi:hypothetical protein PPL_10054 [Heterostelium album PN500]|uniref:Uncharacterized protein n=1 Tax=Heterostelium pallidum (strain ATCC 26659 / Pp 5 / PN500) TaxID=670386 RepID=D3BQ71_HETP5|nr:hypothetical protein PPL_10054 [Heterostelium album PN500]EFA76291.1 hypothetical protein PPL_10054 [Heterostelium album PN500]|eukprot:XP_020428423.1 hypothetical protein PPL_10054 [Heterostelium album PN500]
MSNENKQLIPPFRFAIIEEGLYRGSYPTEKNLRFLKRLKLKTIVSLTPKPPLKPFLNFCERYNTTSKHFPVSKFKDDVTIDASQVVQLLELMIDPANLPLYCHCLDGANVTGTIFMCLRKVQNWNLSAIISEFTRFTRGTCISSSESEFVETFKAELDIPLTIPTWLWQGVRMTKHPTLKLRLIGPSPTQHQQQQHHSQHHHHQQQHQQQQQIGGSAFALINNGGGNSPAINSPTNSSLQTQQTLQSTTTISPLVTGVNSNTNIYSNQQSTLTSTTTSIEKNSNSNQLTIQINNNNNSNNNNNQTTTTTTKTPILNSIGVQSSSLNPSTPSGSNVIPSISTLIASGGISGGAIGSSAGNNPSSSSSSSSSTSHTKDKDKKKKIEDIKLQFDAGKFNQVVDSKSLDALSLERLPIIQQQQQSSTMSTSTVSNSTTTTSTSTAATPTTNRTLLQTSSEVAFTNINLLQNLNIAKQQQQQQQNNEN